MPTSSRSARRSTRREFLAATGAGLIATGLASHARGADSAPAVVRKRVKPNDTIDPSSPQYNKDLASYAKAVEAMLKLPASDPHNWYRIAITHLFDCPHHNWWFLPWHRGYLGWFERICRVHSGDPHFALPFWDWNADLKESTTSKPFDFPDLFCQGTSVLRPSHALYLQTRDEVKAKFENQLGYLEDNATKKLLLKNHDVSAHNPPLNMLLSCFNAETIPAGMTDLHVANSPELITALADQQIRESLQASKYLDFSSGTLPANSHSSEFSAQTQGILERLPHDHIHVSSGRLMRSNMSPLHPIFFLHHSNVDRLWDIWTRKQIANGQPWKPEGADLSTWENEPFPFFYNENQQPLPDAKSGDYTSIGAFNYTYASGTGENQILGPGTPRFASSTFAMKLDPKGLELATEQFASDILTKAFDEKSNQDGQGQPLIARLTIRVPNDTVGLKINVFVNPLETQKPTIEDLGFAGSFVFLPHHRGMEMDDQAEPYQTITYQISISQAVQKLIKANRLNYEKPLIIQVYADTKDKSKKQQIQLTKVEIQAFKLP
jgi:hypothetical protein